MLTYDRAQGTYTDTKDTQTAIPAQPATDTQPTAAAAMPADTRPAVAYNNSSLTPATAKPIANGANMVDDILMRVAASTQQTPYVTQQALDSTRQVLSNDMGAYRQAMDTHMASRPTMSPRIASEMAYANRADANPILRQNSNAEVAMFNSRMSDWDAQGKAIADKYGMVNKMQGQLSGQETEALKLDMALRNQNNNTGLQVAKEGMELQALPTKIEQAKANVNKTKADAEYARSHAAEAQGRGAREQAEADQINKGGMSLKDKAAMIKAHEAHIATQQAVKAKLNAKLLEKGVLTEQEQAILDEADADIAEKKKAIAGIDPEYAKRTGIPTEAESIAAKRLKLAKDFVARATKGANDASIFNRSARNQDDPALMRKRLIDAGYTEEEAQQALGSRYVAPQQQQAIPTSQQQKVAPPAGFKDTGKTSGGKPVYTDGKRYWTP